MKTDEKAVGGIYERELPHCKGEVSFEWARDREGIVARYEKVKREARVHRKVVRVVVVQTSFLRPEQSSGISVDALSKLRVNLPQKRANIQDGLKQGIISYEV